MSLLPNAATEAAYEALDPKTDYGPALRELAKRHSLEGTPLRFAAGSRPVFALSDAVVKLYPAVDADSFATELSVLAAVFGRVPFETPEVTASGTLGTWSYLVMSRVRGRPLRDGLDDSAEARRDLFRAMGAGVASLHKLEVELPGPDWPTWVAERQQGCAAWHRGRGATDVWCARIDPYLDRWLPELNLDGASLLHTEIMREHVFVRPVEGRSVFSGLIDWEPSWVGPVGYELSSVGLFTSEGESGLFGAFLDGYGFDGDREALAHRTMAWALLHRYAHLKWWLKRTEPRGPRRGFDDLAREWFL